MTKSLCYSIVILNRQCLKDIMDGAQTSCGSEFHNGMVDGKDDLELWYTFERANGR